MATTAGTSARGLPWPGDSSAADVPSDTHALVLAIEAMMNSPLVLGSSVTATGDVIATGGALNAAASVGGWLVLSHTSAGAGLKRSLLKSLSGATSLQSIPDAATTTTKVGFSMDHATGAVDFPNGYTGKRLDSPYFRAYRSGAAASFATTATVIFDTEAADPNGWYDPATGIFQPTVAGTYRTSWAIALAGALTADNWLGSILGLNGSIWMYGSLSFQRGTAGLVTTGTALVPMNGTSDQVIIGIQHNQGGSVAVSTSTPKATHFEAERIGA